MQSFRYLFFFSSRRRHTRWPRDWSSDVCSSDLDANETDAHYQLGRIARAEGRLPEAIGHFGEVVARDDAHAQHEVWREVGATYLAANQFADARDALERFLDRTPFNYEALYL